MTVIAATEESLDTLNNIISSLGVGTSAAGIDSASGLFNLGNVANGIQISATTAGAMKLISQTLTGYGASVGSGLAIVNDFKSMQDDNTKLGFISRTHFINTYEAKS